MPIHSWNWFRAVGVGNDLKSWYGDNPQVDKDISIHYQDYCSWRDNILG